MTLPEVIPVFPLPNVVFFPRMPLPLHVFEPRYRDMVRDAARGARLIGMALLRGEWQREYSGRPPIFATGTVGEMVHVEELPDGRFNIVLRGLREYTIVRELERHAYREAVVSWRAADPAPLPSGLRDAVGALVRRYLALRG
ncbi:MAG TPA: LON peptidase substrate-binding domain-containing protein, partial [Candidatus Elarobacter sp.]|nr:LON peptidase substrate-binding domain-containing protein [Candidatus Elarobacter sp.]